MIRTLGFGLISCIAFAGTVRLREQAMDPGFVATPHPLEVARPADLVRASEATALPARVGSFTLSGVRRGGNDSRQLIYRHGSEAVSVFATGRRFRTLATDDGWSAVEIGYGRVGRMRRLQGGMAALTWIHQGRRCTAVADLPPSELRDFVSRAADAAAFPPAGS